MLDTPLSKSALQAGAQCPRMLWFRYNNPSSADLVGKDAVEQEQFIIGDIVGEAAQGYFSDGDTVIINTERGFSPQYYKEYARETMQAMQDPSVCCIAEATFYTGDLVVFIDLLHRNPKGGWDIYEVKSTNRIGPVHVRDASWQTFVARELCGIDIKNTYLMHPYAGWNRIKEHGENVDPNDFEVVDDFTDFIYSYSSGMPTPEQGWMNGMTIEEAITYLSDMVLWEVPPEALCEPGKGTCCNSPYRCNFINICKKTLENEMINNVEMMNENVLFSVSWYEGERCFTKDGLLATDAKSLIRELLASGNEDIYIADEQGYEYDADEFLS